MNRDLRFYFLVIGLPAFLLALGGLRLLNVESSRAYTLGRDALQAKATLAAADVRRRIEAELVLPNGVSVEYGGMIEEQEKSEKALTMMILLGVVLVYMVMAAQFESLLHPLLIMFSVPFAFSGVSAVLHLTGTPLSMSAYIGMVLLVGVVVNNAIVLVDYVNLLRARGRALRDAIVEGGRQRLRPVLITTCTTVLGMMPMATSHGDGSATWRPLGLVVVGGLALASVVTPGLVAAASRARGGVRGRAPLRNTLALVRSQPAARSERGCLRVRSSLRVPS